MKSIADAFADRLDGIISNLMSNIDAADFNPVRCCLCVMLGAEGRVEAVVKGYGVCVDHMLVMDQHGTLDAALDVLKPTPVVTGRRRRTG